MLFNGAYSRRRGTAIVDTPNGIMVVRQDHSQYLLPGGGARRNETRLEATIRELNEETGLHTIEISYKFTFQKSKIFRVIPYGDPRPKNEISEIAYYKPGSTIPLSYNTKKIIEYYWNLPT